MGLSASQGRMLLLTARKSDLEFRAQQISQKRLVLSQQLEEIAMDYENSSSNRQMIFNTLYLNGENTGDSSATKSRVNLTYATLVSGTLRQFSSENSGIRAYDKTANQEYSSNVAYRLVDAEGALVVSDIKEIPGTLQDDTTTKPATAATNNATAESSSETNKIIPMSNGRYKLVNKDGEQIGIYVVDNSLKFGSTDPNGDTDGPNYLQDCLRNGKYLIQKGSVDTENDKIKWNSISWDSTSNISDTYYTEDDDKAKAKYDRLQTQIQNQDKKLELELDSIETQRTAVTTEVESVQKVIDDNIEDSFKTFA